MIEKLNIDNLAQILILSNTPYYLFKKFSNDESVKSLAFDNSSEKLINFFYAYIKRNIKKTEELVVLYSIIVALSFKTKREVSEFFNQLDKLNIKWGNYFKNIYLSRLIPESISSFDLQYKMPSKSLNYKSFSIDNTTKTKQEIKTKII
jgi:hypothetical protein